MQQHAKTLSWLESLEYAISTIMHWQLLGNTNQICTTEGGMGIFCAVAVIAVPHN